MVVGGPKNTGDAGTLLTLKADIYRREIFPSGGFVLDRNGVDCIARYLPHELAHIHPVKMVVVTHFFPIRPRPETVAEQV